MDKHTVTCTGGVDAVQDVWDNFKVRCVLTTHPPAWVSQLCVYVCVCVDMEFQDTVLTTLINDNEFETRILKVEFTSSLLVSLKKITELNLSHSSISLVWHVYIYIRYSHTGLLGVSAQDNKGCAA